MTVKERIIRQSIAAAEKELAEIEYLINTPFLSLIIEHRQKVFGMPREELTGKVLDAAIQHEGGSAPRMGPLTTPGPRQ